MNILKDFDSKNALDQNDPRVEQEGKLVKLIHENCKGKSPTPRCGPLLDHLEKELRNKIEFIHLDPEVSSQNKIDPLELVRAKVHCQKKDGERIPQPVSALIQGETQACPLARLAGLYFLFRIRFPSTQPQYKKSDSTRSLGELLPPLTQNHPHSKTDEDHTCPTVHPLTGIDEALSKAFERNEQSERSKPKRTDSQNS